MMLRAPRGRAHSDARSDPAFTRRRQPRRTLAGVGVKGSRGPGGPGCKSAPRNAHLPLGRNPDSCPESVQSLERRFGRPAMQHNRHGRGCARLISAGNPLPLCGGQGCPGRLGGRPVSAGLRGCRAGRSPRPPLHSRRRSRCGLRRTPDVGSRPLCRLRVSRLSGQSLSRGLSGGWRMWPCSTTCHASGGLPRHAQLQILSLWSPHNSPEAASAAAGRRATATHFLLGQPARKLRRIGRQGRGTGAREEG